ncbi:MAG: two-component regulator propeller domain-containing protein [Prevotella sp.]
MKKIILCLVCVLYTCMLHADGIGTWKAYMAYHDIQEIEQAGNKLYVLASDNLYDYNTTDNSIQTYDKVNALSDCGIAHIAWCNAAKRLVIIFQNQNIDLLDEKGNVVNVSDYYNKSMTEDKTVYSIYIQDHFAYLCTGFGIIKLNVRDAEIADTYLLGFRTDYCYIADGNIYAASSTHGLYSASLTTNLLDKANWKRTGNYVAKSKTIDPELLAIVNQLNPGGPKYNNFGFMRLYKGKLYTVGGGFTMLKDLRRPACVQILDKDEWTIYPDNLSESTGHYVIDFNTVSVDPKNENHIFAGGRTGLIEFENCNYFKDHTYENSPLRGTENVSATNKEYTLVHGTTFDAEGALWCLNSGSGTTSILQYKDKEWYSYNKQEIMRDGRSLDHLCHPFFDSRNLLWFVNNNFNYAALACYQPSTDAINTYYNFINEDNTRVNVNYVRCVAEDKQGNIWIGTDVGPLMLEPGEFNSENPIFQQIKVPRNDGTNYADYLLAGIDITCMAIDGGNRKWFGTANNGIYLIDSDNMTEIQHFTASNSSLLSDNIESIAINEETGEVFIGTNKGLCSYMSDAIEPVEEMNKDVTYAYPNPVRPDYTGPITIVGLTMDADIKITTSNGILVAQGRSNGGTFVWDGTDTNGKRVASGVYMVQTATAEGKKGTVCKIAIVN